MNEQIDQKVNQETTPVWIKKGYPSFELMEWFEKENDYFLLRNFNLNSNSFIVDIGCYNSTWLKDMYCKYNCNCVGIEPITKYYEQGNRLFSNSEKVKLHNYGLTIEPNQKTCTMSMMGDASRIGLNENLIDVKMVYAKDFFQSLNKDIDVLQINIEGYEYDLVPFLLYNNLLNRVKNIQIQFHNFYSNSRESMDSIISDLEICGFKTKFNYPFIWYGGVRE